LQCGVIKSNEFCLEESVERTFELLQSGVSGATQGDQRAVCHEEDLQAELDAEEPDRAGFLGEGHPFFHRQSLRCQHVLQL
jgi:hypothetical protein